MDETIKNLRGKKIKKRKVNEDDGKEREMMQRIETEIFIDASNGNLNLHQTGAGKPSVVEMRKRFPELSAEFTLAKLRNVVANAIEKAKKG